jgi:hypothetical protein
MVVTVKLFSPPYQTHMKQNNDFLTRNQLSWLNHKMENSNSCYSALTPYIDVY